MGRNNHEKLNIGVLSLICTITAVLIIIIQTSFEINNDFLNNLVTITCIIIISLNTPLRQAIIYGKSFSI